MPGSGPTGQDKPAEPAGSPKPNGGKARCRKGNSIDLFVRDEDELRKWLSKAEPGHTKDFDVGKERRDALEKLCEMLGGLETACYGAGTNRVLVVMKTEDVTHVPIDVSLDQGHSSPPKRQKTAQRVVENEGSSQFPAHSSSTEGGVKPQGQPNHDIMMVDDSDSDESSSSGSSDEENDIQEALRRSLLESSRHDAAPAGRSTANARDANSSQAHRTEKENVAEARWSEESGSSVVVLDDSDDDSAGSQQSKGPTRSPPPSSSKDADVVVICDL